MGRPKGSRNRPKDAARNGGLSDDQSMALFFSHKRAYEAALAKKKKADADFKNACKLAKSELGDEAVASIKDALLLETDDGEAKIRAAIDRQLRVARWMAVPLGSQSDLFSDGVDRTPAIDRARAEGRRDRLAGKPLKPPYAPELPQHDSYSEGWYEGAKLLADAQRRDDGVLFEAGDPPPPIGGAEPASPPAN